MLTKDQYILIREQEEIPVSLFYEFYVDKAPNPSKVITLEEFEKVYPQFMATLGNQIMISPSGTKSITFEGAINKVFTHFNEKFKD